MWRFLCQLFIGVSKSQESQKSFFLMKIEGKKVLGDILSSCEVKLNNTIHEPLKTQNHKHWKMWQVPFQN